MAPSTKGLNLFSLSSKKAAKKSAVQGDMVLKNDVPKAATPAVDPLKAQMLADPKKQATANKKAAEEPSKKDVKPAAADKNPEPVQASSKLPEPVPSKKEATADSNSKVSTPAAEPATPSPATTKPTPAPVAPPAPAAAPAPVPAASPAPAPAPVVVTPAPAPAAAPAAAPQQAPVELPLAAQAAAKAAARSSAAAAAVAAVDAAEAAQPSLQTKGGKSAAALGPKAAPQPDFSTQSRMRAEDARAAWQTRPRVPVRLLDNYVNFMVVGESGLGKTTFINNLVSSYTTCGRAHDGSSTSLADFQSDPDSLKTVLEPMEVREAGRRLHMSVQDMPGWADDINLVRFLRIMVNFILQQRAKDYELLAGGRALTESAMCGQLQNSITACIYFLTPHRVKKVDLIMMSALSQLVTVIPVIAKADTMTDEELATYRQEIRTRLAAPYKYVHSKTLAPLDFNAFKFSDDVMHALNLIEDHLPLAVITSNKHEPIEDAALLSHLGLQPNKAIEQPVRTYKWGLAYALNREHSDLIILKRLLLGDRVESLYAMLDESYNRYVAFCEQYEEAGKQLPLVVQDELACSAYLEYDDYSNAKSALDAAQQAMSTLMAENKVLVERLQALEREKSGRGGFRTTSIN